MSKKLLQLEAQDVKSTLLYFGLDYLTMLVGNTSSEKIARFVYMFDFIFSLSHNSSNASEYYNQYLGNTGLKCNVIFGTGRDSNYLYLHFDQHRIITVEKIDENSNLKNLTGNKYQYRIQFYSSFFSLQRLQRLSVEKFFTDFYSDYVNDSIVHSISRIDICADLTNFSPLYYRDQISISSQSGLRFSAIGLDMHFKEAETIGISASSWSLRMYNKNKEIEVKGKHALFPEYLEEKSVTRIEIELKKRLREFKPELAKVLDTQWLLGVYEKVLNNKYLKAKFVPSILGIMQRNGYKPFLPILAQPSYGTLSNFAQLDRHITKHIKLMGMLGYTSEELFKYMGQRIIERGIQKAEYRKLSSETKQYIESHHE